jgi:nucleoside-diphosphate-sugar epimerase
MCTGRGRGPVSGRSRQAYDLADVILEKGRFPVVGQGKTRWNNVHVADLSDLYVLLVEKAVQNDSSGEIWGPKGYMLAENGEHVWADLSRRLAHRAAELGYVKGELEEYPLGKDEAVELAGFGAVTWGLNSRGKAGRARTYLGWRPHRPSIEDCLDEILEDERRHLGLA